jgi:PIN domain nuclease of toxin-antitoxin system
MRPRPSPAAARRLLDVLALGLVPGSERHAVRAAELRRSHKDHGLSTADCVCLALAEERKLPVLTSDRAWRRVEAGVEIRLIR